MKKDKARLNLRLIKGLLNIHINFTNRVLYTFISFIALLIIGVGVFAFGTSTPATFGHSAGELDLSGGVNGNAVFNGNVGIGTTAPSEKLDVKGSARFLGTGDGSYFNYGTNELVYIRAGKIGQPVYIQDNNNGNVLIASGGGNVGIGTTAPTAKLDVVAGTDTWAADFFGLSTSDKVRIGTVGGVATIGANNNAGSAWADLSINPGGNTLFATTSGNVGIGTTAPTQKLDVAGTGKFNAIDLGGVTKTAWPGSSTSCTFGTGSTSG